MPPHNLREVINATLEIMDNPEIEVIDLLNNNIITGPDFPTGGIILGKSGIRKAYETGRGSIVLTSRTTIEEVPNSKNRSQIIISEIPYQVNKKDEIEKIGQLVKDKVIEGVDEIRDESNLEGIRVVVELKKDVIPNLILNTILKLTAFQKSFSINNLVLVNNEPKCLGIKEIIFEYLKHVDIIVVRKTEFLLVEAKRKIHILEALMKVLETKDNTDLAISIIRTSKTVEEEYQRFTESFGFDKEQIDSIVNRRLQTLSNMEINKLADEYQGLLNSIVEYDKLLNDKVNRDNLIKNQLIEMRDKFGDDRRTEISNNEADLEDEDLIPVEDILIIMTSNGWMKRVSPDTYRSQHRGGKGVKGISTYEEDSVSKIIAGNTHKDVLFFTDLGKVHKLRGYRIPEGSRTSKGIPIQNFIPALLENETVKSIIVIDNYEEELGSLIFVTKNGIIKKTSTKEYSNINKSGKIAINLNDDDSLIDVKYVTPNTKILICNSNGKLCKFDESGIRQVGRNSIGVKGMNVDNGSVIAVATSLDGSEVLVLSVNGYGKMTNIDDYRETARGAKGVTTMRINEKTGDIINMKVVQGDEDLLVTTDKGIFLRTSLSSLRSMSRVTSGVKIIKLDDNQNVSGIAIVPPILEEITEVEENQE
jgi:DNA gyrase subunit A